MNRYPGNHMDSGIVTLPRELKTRPGAPQTHLAYITGDEAQMLQEHKPGTPHKGPHDIPNYDAWDMDTGSYYTSEQVDYGGGAGGGGGNVPENVLAMRDRFSPADILKGDIASYPVEEVDEVSDLDLFEPYLENSQMDITHLYPYHGRGELSEDFDYSQFPSVVEEVIDEDVTDDSVVENIEEVIEEPDDEEIFNQTYEFIQDRGDDPDLPTPWEYMIKMQDLLGWEDERMIQHLIDNGVLRAK